MRFIDNHGFFADSATVRLAERKVIAQFFYTITKRCVKLDMYNYAYPFCRVRDDCIRLLINRELVGQNDEHSEMFSQWTENDFNLTHSTRDVFWEGMCDDGCQLLADKLGWGVSI